MAIKYKNEEFIKKANASLGVGAQGVRLSDLKRNFYGNRGSTFDAITYYKAAFANPVGSNRYLSDSKVLYAASCGLITTTNRTDQITRELNEQSGVFC